jgi:hypothetical protein
MLEILGKVKRAEPLLSREEAAYAVYKACMPAITFPVIRTSWGEIDALMRQPPGPRRGRSVRHVNGSQVPTGRDAPATMNDAILSGYDPLDWPNETPRTTDLAGGPLTVSQCMDTISPVDPS